MARRRGALPGRRAQGDPRRPHLRVGRRRHGRQHPARPVRRRLYGSWRVGQPATAGDASETVTIAGKFCESGDMLIRDIALPRLAPGDLLAVPMAGAYTLAMASNYNLAPRPAVVLVGGRAGTAHPAPRELRRPRAPRRAAAGATAPHGRASTSTRRWATTTSCSTRSTGPPRRRPSWSGASATATRASAQTACCGDRCDGAAGPDPFGLRLFNPDGSEFEKSGNGCASSPATCGTWGCRRAAISRSDTPGGPVSGPRPGRPGQPHRHGDGAGCRSTARHPGDRAGPRGGRRTAAESRRPGLRITAATIGNPHCVVFVDGAYARAGATGSGPLARTASAALPATAPTSSSPGRSTRTRCRSRSGSAAPATPWPRAPPAAPPPARPSAPAAARARSPCGCPAARCWWRSTPAGRCG